MKFNKEIVIILVLTSLLLSALGTAFYYYTEGQKALISGNRLKVIYIASKNIKKHTKITKKDVRPTHIAQKFLVTKPLLLKDIIGKFANEKIYKDDTFTKQKLLRNLHKKKKVAKVVVDNFQFSSYNMAFNMFRNPNYSLNTGDTIDIISVYKVTKKKQNGSLNDVQYVAKNNRVLGFISNGTKTNKTLKKSTRTRVINKKKIVEPIIIKANEIILDIRKKNLLHLIDDYNRGNQLWMVQTKPIVKKHNKIVKKKMINRKRNYPFKLYNSRGTNKNFQATIHYADQKSAAVTKSKIIKLSYSKQCLNSNNFLIGISNKVHLRTGPTNRNKIVRTVYRNYIIPYTNKINANWYRTCDGHYVHRLEATVITKKQAMSRLGK